MTEYWALQKSRARREALRHTHLEGDDSTMDELSRKIERMPAFTAKIRRQQALARQALARQALAAEQEIERHAEGENPDARSSLHQGSQRAFETIAV